MLKKKVLFIEDETEIVDLMRTRLEANGYQMFSAYDGEEGLKKVEENKPDLILLDIVIPKINGLIVCQRLKNGSKTKDIPIIVVSASGGKDLPKRCREAGSDDVVIKPFEAEEILDKISKLLDK